MKMLWDHTLRRRLSALARGHTPSSALAAELNTREGSCEVRQAMRPEEKCPPSDSVLMLTPAEAPDTLPGLERYVVAGALYELRRPAAALGDWAPEALACWRRTQTAEMLAALGITERNVALSEIVFVDVETAGLANAPLFLAGLLSWENDMPVVCQLLARDYTEEPTVLAETRRLLQAARVVFSFNGRTFDVPYLAARLSYHRLETLCLPCHLDLLPLVRRRWKSVLPDCRLQTLEQQICRRQRSGDIAGAEIPQAYHNFVATGDPRLIWRVIEHNAYDLVTLAELAARLATPERSLVYFEKCGP